MLIILDRDGVINYDSPSYIKSPDEWLAIPGSLEAIARLNQAGHSVVVATNQSGIGRGYYNVATLEAIHEKMALQLKQFGGHLDAIFYCPHTPKEGCECRKPKPGLFLQIAERFHTDFTNALVIGDSLTDIEAAHAVNCKAVLVATGREKIDQKRNHSVQNVRVFNNLLEVTNVVVRNEII